MINAKISYYEYYKFVESRLTDEDTLDMLAYRMYQECLELINELFFGFYSKQDTLLELGDILFYFVALQSKFKSFISYEGLPLNEIKHNEVYENDSIERLGNSYLMFFVSGIISFIYDYEQDRELIEEYTLNSVEGEEMPEHVVALIQNLSNGINFYSTVLFELIATIAHRFDFTIEEVIELNIDKLVQRDLNGKH